MHISVKMQEWDAFAQPLVTRSETGGRVPTTVALYIHKSMGDNRLSGLQMQLEHFAFSDSSPSSSSPPFLPFSVFALQANVPRPLSPPRTDDDRCKGCNLTSTAKQGV